MYYFKVLFFAIRTHSFRYNSGRFSLVCFVVGPSVYHLLMVTVLFFLFQCHFSPKEIVSKEIFHREKESCEGDSGVDDDNFVLFFRKRARRNLLKSPKLPFNDIEWEIYIFFLSEWMKEVSNGPPEKKNWAQMCFLSPFFRWRKVTCSIINNNNISANREGKKSIKRENSPPLFFHSLFGD